MHLIKYPKLHGGKVLTFLEYEHVGPYDNYGKQKSCPAVPIRTISNRNRSTDGDWALTILMSLFQSAEPQ